MAKKIIIMQLNINDVCNNSIPQNNNLQVNRYKLYNLLFNGKISLKEYLNALTSIKSNKEK